MYSASRESYSEQVHQQNRGNRHAVRFIAIGTILTLALGGVFAFATVTPSAQATKNYELTACVNKKTEKVRVIVAPQKCRKTERAVALNVSTTQPTPAIRYGVGAPTPTLGHDGDFYVDTQNYLFYGPRTAGNWGIGQSLIGPAGPQGPMGPAGQQGQQGPRGATGPIGLTGAIGPTGLTGPQGPIGPAGPQGDAGAVGLKGDKGDPGTSFEILGHYDTEAELIQAHPTGLAGDSYLVGAGYLYTWNGTAWTNVGQLQGPKGDKGDQGDQGPIGPTGAQGPIGATGPAGPTGPAGGFGAYGAFYDTETRLLTRNEPYAIPLNVTQLTQGVSIGGTNFDQITMAGAGKYNISFSLQLYNSANARAVVTIWLAKNGVSVANYVPETSTDIYLGTAADSERSVAAWNFFVDAAAGDFYTLMIATNGTAVSIYGDASANTDVPGLPVIPSTILTVNQVG